MNCKGRNLTGGCITATVTRVDGDFSAGFARTDGLTASVSLICNLEEETDYALCDELGRYITDLEGNIIIVRKIKV